MGQAPYDYEVPFMKLQQIAVERGYQVEIMEGEVDHVYVIGSRDIDIWPVWLPSIHETYQDKYGDKYELGSAILMPVGW